MKVILKPGETLEVGYADEEGRETDGGFEITYSAAGQLQAGHITITTDWPDTLGRSGELYRESFGGPDDGKDEVFVSTVN